MSTNEPATDHGAPPEDPPADPALRQHVDAASSRRAAIAGGVGTTVEYYDYALYGFLAVVIAPQFFPSDDPVASVMAALLLFATGFLLRPIGGIVFGHVGDRYGRKTALIASLLTMGVASAGIGLVPNHAGAGVWATVALIVLRCAQGLSAGGELGGSMTFIAESSGWDRKGTYGAATVVGISLGFATAAAVAGLVSSVLPPEALAAWGWRIPFLLSLPLCLFCLWLRRRADETLTREVRSRSRATLVHVLRSEPSSLALTAGISTAVNGVSYIGLAYLSVHLIQVLRFPKPAVYWIAVVAIVGAGLAALGAGRLADRRGLMVVTRWAMMAFGVVAFPAFALMTLDGIGWMAIGYLALTAVAAVASAPVSAAVPMLFRPELRFTGTALGWNIGAIVAGATTPLIALWLVESTGSPIAPAGFCLLAAALGVMFAALIGRRLQ